MKKKKEHIYEAQVVSVYDGDSIRCDIDMGMYMWSKNRSVRIKGIDTPERRGSQKLYGAFVGDFLRELINNKEVVLRTEKPDKYGRVLADVFVGGKSVAEILVKKGYAKKYDGGTKQTWTQKELNDILNKA